MTEPKTYTAIPIPAVRMRAGDTLRLEATVTDDDHVRIDALSITHAPVDDDDFHSEDFDPDSCDPNWTPDP